MRRASFWASESRRVRRWRLIRWISQGFAFGLVACEGPGGHCGGLEYGDELMFVAGDTFEREPAYCTLEDVGFYPEQEFLFRVVSFPRRPFSGNPCLAGEGPVTTMSEWNISYIYDSGNAERLFHIVADAARGQCRGKFVLELATEDLSVSESPSAATLRVDYWAIPAPYEPGAPPGCPPACSGIIPGTVRKVPRE